MDMLLDYLQEVEPIITISVEQRKFLKEKWHQSGPPSLAALITDSNLAGRPAERTFYINNNKNLTSATYVQAYDAIDQQNSEANNTVKTGQSGTLTVRADLSSNKPTTSVSYKSTGNPPLAVGLSKDIVKTLGGAIGGAIKVKTKITRVKESAARKASRLTSFMRRKVSSAYTIVSSISSKIRNRSNSKTP